jgi:hypothetical protein
MPKNIPGGNSNPLGPVTVPEIVAGGFTVKFSVINSPEVSDTSTEAGVETKLGSLSPFSVGSSAKAPMVYDPAPLRLRA